MFENKYNAQVFFIAGIKLLFHCLIVNNKGTPYLCKFKVKNKLWMKHT
jgi:hypothetical protein